MKIKAVLTLSAVAFICNACASGTRVVDMVNPGFETVSAAGRPEGWRNFYKPLFVDSGAGRGGGNALAFSAAKKGAYVVVFQEVPAHPGMTFRASFWTRSENLVNGYPMLCLEWFGEGGRWLAGHYEKGRNGTSDWRQEYVAATRAPEGTVALRVGLCVTRGGAGKAWFDDVRLETVKPKAVEGVYSSVYRDRAAEGEVVFFANLNTSAAGGDGSGLKAEFTLPFAAGRKTVPASRLSNDWASVSVDASELSSGRVSFRLEEKGRTLGEAELDFVRIGSEPEKGVHIDRYNRLVIDGKAVFPLGMYFGRVSRKDLEIYAEGPFNCLMPYAPVNREQLDLCAAKGLKAFCNIKDWYTFVQRGRNGISTLDDVKRKLTSVVEELKDHPALLGWYMNDEIPIVHIEELKACYRLVRELDLEHPAMTMLYLMPDMRGYLPSFDIGGTDPYPHDNWKQWRNAYDWPKKQLASVFGARPVWQAVQVHDAAAYRKGSREELMKTHPTGIAEMRNLAWQALAAGAKGLLFYSFFDLRKMSWKSSFEEKFGEVCRVAGEIRRFEQVLLSPETEPAAADTSDIGARKWVCGKDTYLAVVNLKNADVTGSVALPGVSGFCEALLGPGPVSRNGNAAGFRLKPFDAAFIRFSPRP